MTRERCALRWYISCNGLPRWLRGKESICQCERPGFDPQVGKIPWRRKWQPTLVFLSGKSMDRGAWWVHEVAKEPDMTEQLNNNNLQRHLLSY